MARASLDISSIRALVARARRRLRLQSAIEGATTAVVLGSAAALAAVFLVRAYIVTPSTGYLLLAGSFGVVAAGAVLAAIRRVDDEDIARRIDTASNLSDRLSTAVAFDRVLRAPGADHAADDETRELMQAAVKDALRAVPRADLRRATPYRAPRDGRVAAVFAGVALAAAGLGLPTRDPKITAIDPERACAAAPVAIHGEWLCGPDAWSDSECTSDRRVLNFHDGDQVHTISVDHWRGGEIDFTVPDLAAQPYKVDVVDGDRIIGQTVFEIVDCKKAQKERPDAVTWDPDDRAYVKDLLDELHQAAQKDQTPELQAYVDKVRQLLQQAEEGQLTKEQLLDELKKAEDELHQGEEPNQDEVNKDLSDTGKQLEKNELTKELAKALEQGDLQKAKQEMEKLADKMDKGELSDKQKEDLAKALQAAAKQFQQKDEQRDKDAQDKIDQAQKEQRELETKRDQEKDPQKKEDLERRLEKKKRELEQLQKDKQQKDESTERRALKRLEKDMDDAAKDLQQPKDQQKDKDKQQGDKDKQQGDKDKQQGGDKSKQGGDKDKGDKDDGQRQASQKMKQAAEETGRVDDDQRKTASTKKVASQMDDLREAMRRAKRKGNKDGGQNPFGKNGKQSDFERRARGEQGEKGAWEKGKGQGQGQGQNGGKADGQPDGPSDTWGVGHDEHLEGDPTAKQGNDKDQGESGIQGKGPSRRETILSAAQKGFASTGYQKVYADYKKIVEEVMNSEKVPSSYKYYIKKYFTKIKPHSMD